MLLEAAEVCAALDGVSEVSHVELGVGGLRLEFGVDEEAADRLGRILAFEHAIRWTTGVVVISVAANVPAVVLVPVAIPALAVVPVPVSIPKPSAMLVGLTVLFPAVLAPPRGCILVVPCSQNVVVVPRRIGLGASVGRTILREPNIEAVFISSATLPLATSFPFVAATAAAVGA